ncbi:MAG: hypothetical protein NVS9B4_18760 [Candidatus Acidiferrum sp.]
METRHFPRKTLDHRCDLKSEQVQGKKWVWGGSPDLPLCGEHPHLAAPASQTTSDSWGSRQGIAELLPPVAPRLALPKDKIITVSVIAGPSKGLAKPLVKPHISIGRVGGGAEIEIDDGQLSDLHCAIGVKDEMIRLCDLDSHCGTYFKNERVWFATLEHLSEFRVGSSLLLVTVRPAQSGPAGACY